MQGRLAYLWFMRTRGDLTRLVVVGAAITALSGCGVSVDRTGPSAAASSAAQSSARSSSSSSAAPTSSSSATPNAATSGGVYLFEVPAESGRGSGAHTSASLDGEASGQVYANSSALWVGCDGNPDIVNFTLGGKYQTLRGRVGFRKGVAAGVTATVTVYADGKPMMAFQADHDGGYPLQLLVTDVNILSMSVIKGEGECGNAQESYLVIADGVLR